MALNQDLRRIGFYLAGIVREYAPRGLMAGRLHRELRELDATEFSDDLLNRVSYYCKLTTPQRGAAGAALRNISKEQDRYYIDFMEVATGFPRDMKVNYLFGDITHVPDEPTIVKSRPIADCDNSVVMKLDKFRHFNFVDDPVPFDQKKPAGVWRGRLNDPPRKKFIQDFGNSKLGDFGYIGRPIEGIDPKPFLSIAEQLAFKYVVSIEGHDVATNLKWIMASNSLCLSPPLIYETWYMEGCLVPGYHFVELKPDLSDLEAKIEYYEAHPDEAHAIIANAQAYTLPFRDKKQERVISLLVLLRYFEMTGQGGGQQSPFPTTGGDVQ